MTKTQRVKKTSKTEIRMDEQGVFHIKGDKGIYIDREDVEECLWVMKTMTKKKKDNLILMDVSHVKGITYRARRYLHAPEMNYFILAVAGIVRNPLRQGLNNFYMRVNAPSYRIRLFLLRKNAMAWLQEFE